MLTAVLPNWPQAHRLISSHFPPIAIFEGVTNEEDFEIAYAWESMTNDRLRHEVGLIDLVPKEDRVFGQGASVIMAAFTHIGLASRFTDGSYGVYYAADTLQTAIAETVFHRERFLQYTDEGDTEITLRQYINQPALPLLDITDKRYLHLHDPDIGSYTPCQQFAQQFRDAGHNGLVYNSVRHKEGMCIAVFNPKAVTMPTQGAHFRYVYSKHHQRIVNVFKIEEI